MNGAESLVRTLRASGITTCFANPGTSEMQFVDALDRTGAMHCVLGLFEGVASGAADGWARMTGVPGLTLLHLAPGLGNAAANLHNARKARTPLVNLVGDHATGHLAYDAPLTADVAGAAAPFSDRVMTARTAATLATDGAHAVAEAASGPGRVVTLIAPSDTGWDEGGVEAPIVAPRPREPFDGAALERAAATLASDAPCVIYAGGGLLADTDATALLAGIADATGARLFIPVSSRRVERGAGRALLPKLPYAVDDALHALAGARHAILIEAPEPIAFFGYPDKPSRLLPEDCERIPVATPEADGAGAVRALAEALGVRPGVKDAPPPVAPQAGPIDPARLAAAIAAALPADAIVIDEGVTVGRDVYAATAGAPPMTWLAITGGAIGIGPPLATGAAIAAPDRPVVAVQADGSAMYTIQALWTQAREGANVTTVILANRSYAILKNELFRVGANPGRSALDMLEIDRPALDFVALARGMGVPARRVEDAATLRTAIDAATREPGPFLIEAVID